MRMHHWIWIPPDLRHVPLPMWHSSTPENKKHYCLSRRETCICNFMVGVLQQHWSLDVCLNANSHLVPGCLYSCCAGTSLSASTPISGTCAESPNNELICVKNNLFLVTFLLFRVATCIMNLHLEARRSRKILPTGSPARVCQVWLWGWPKFPPTASCSQVLHNSLGPLNEEGHKKDDINSNPSEKDTNSDHFSCLVWKMAPAAMSLETPPWDKAGNCI